jgi:Cof subfamily protein (haloacid dehalogenase superfamily)
VSATVRLIASDLDGTLIRSDYTFSPRTAAAITAAVDAGIGFVAATGRSQWTAAPILSAVPAIRYAVCSNGSSLYDLHEQRSLWELPIADDVVDDILGRLATALPGCVYGWETATDLHYEAGFILYRPNLDRPASADLAIGERPTPIRKLMICHPEVQHYELLDRLRPLMPGGATASTSGAPFVEVTGPGIDKAFGVQRLCHQLGVAPAEVLAFGDNHNDLAMLQWAGRAVAMANAQPAVLEAIPEVTARYDEDGVALVLESLL